MPRRKNSCCPHCGGNTGVYTKTTYVNVPYALGWDGEAQDNSEMYDNAEDYRGGRTAYCQDCHKAVCRISSLEKQWRNYNGSDMEEPTYE